MAIKKTTVHRHTADAVPTFSRLRDKHKTVAGFDEDIRGRMVRDKDGQEVGKIEGLLLDDVEEKVRFMEVASGGFLGLGETKSFIPVDAIKRITDDDVFIGHSREHVAGAPRYDPSLVMDEARYFSDLYPYYGFQRQLGFSPSILGYSPGHYPPLSGPR
jgi:sporulation protein YlmC with PRC-barrel domain